MPKTKPKSTRTEPVKRPVRSPASATKPAGRTAKAKPGGSSVPFTTRLLEADGKQHRHYLSGTTFIEEEVETGRRTSWLVHEDNQEWGAATRQAIAEGSWGKVVGDAAGFGEQFRGGLPAEYLDPKNPPAHVNGRPDNPVYPDLDCSKAPTARTPHRLSSRYIKGGPSDGRRALILASDAADSMFSLAVLHAPEERFAFTFTMSMSRQGGRPSPRGGTFYEAVFAGELTILQIGLRLGALGPSGVVHWTCDTEEPLVAPAPVVSQGVAATWPKGNKVHGVHVGTGKRLWRAALKGTSARLAGSEAGIFAVTDRRELLCLDPRTGETRWSVEGGAHQHLAIGSDLYNGSYAALRSLDPDTGNVRWEVPDGELKAVLGDRLLVAIGDRVALVERANGATIDELPTPPPWCVVVAGDTLVQVDKVKDVVNISAYALSDGAPRWRIPIAEVLGADAPAQRPLLAADRSLFVFGSKTCVRLAFE